MAKVLVATDKPFAPVAIQKINSVLDNAGYQLALLEKYTDKQQLLDAVTDVDAIIIRSDKITAEVLDAAKNLKIVVRAGAGYDNVDLEAATAKGVCVMNTPGQNSNAVAELVLGMMVFIARGGFDGKPGKELKGKKLGIHAYGNVGQNVCRVARGFGMEVYAYDPYCVPKIKEDGVINVDSAEELYSTCNYVSLHIPAVPATINSINFELLSKMPEGGVLVNTARKEVIDEEGILKLMQERTDFTYISDIAPDNKEDYAPFEGRYFFTPKKMGAQTGEANVNAGLAAAEQIVDYIKNGVETFRVNK